MRGIKILSTRPLSDTLIEKAASHGIVIDLRSFIKTGSLIDHSRRTLIYEAALKPASIVITSMNAAELVLAELKEKAVKPQWYIYTLAGITKDILTEYFHPDLIAGTARNASLLADKIIDDNREQVIFFCGNIRRDELPEKLQNQNIHVEEVIVYETTLTPHTISEDYAGIMFFSPSAVESFFSNNKIAFDTTLFAIGDTTCQKIKQYVENRVIISETPNKDQMVQNVIQYCLGKHLVS